MQRNTDHPSMPHLNVPHPPHPADRRKHRRIAQTQPCKVYRSSCASYALAHTADYSIGGALLDVVTTRPVVVGERLDLAIASTAAGVIAGSDFRSCIVVRANTPLGMAQRVAVRFG